MSDLASRIEAALTMVKPIRRRLDIAEQQRDAALQRCAALEAENAILRALQDIDQVRLGRVGRQLAGRRHTPISIFHRKPI